MLYSDALVDVGDDWIVFKWYFFPFGSKRVEFARVERIETRKPSLREGKWRLWGTFDLRSWFPLDWKRPSRDKIFVAFLRDTSRRIVFTVEDSAQFEEVLRAKGLPMADSQA